MVAAFVMPHKHFVHLSYNNCLFADHQFGCHCRSFFDSLCAYAELCVCVWVSLPGNHKNHNRHQTRLNADLPDVIRSHCNVIAHNLLPPLAHLWQQLWSSSLADCRLGSQPINHPLACSEPIRCGIRYSKIAEYTPHRVTHHPQTPTPNPRHKAPTHAIVYPKRTPHL